MSPLTLANTGLPSTLAIPITPFWIAVGVGGLVLIGIPGLIGALNGFLTLIARFKQSPPLHEVYATKIELHDSESRMDEKLKVHHEAISKDLRNISAEGKNREIRLHDHISSADKHRGSVDQELKSIASQLGRLTGMLEEMHTQNKRRAQ